MIPTRVADHTQGRVIERMRHEFETVVTENGARFQHAPRAHSHCGRSHPEHRAGAVAKDKRARLPRADAEVLNAFEKTDA